MLICLATVEDMSWSRRSFGAPQFTSEPIGMQRSWRIQCPTRGAGFQQRFLTHNRRFIRADEGPLLGVERISAAVVICLLMTQSRPTGPISLTATSRSDKL